MWSWIVIKQFYADRILLWGLAEKCGDRMGLSAVAGHVDAVRLAGEML